MPTIHAIDISHYQDVTSWDAIANAGIVGVMHKCTEGTSYMDPTYETNRDGALAAGLRFGAYHFLKHGSATEQMEFFLDMLDLEPGSRVAIDYEDQACTLDDLEEALTALTCLDPSLQVCVYAGGLLKGQVDSVAYPWLTPYALWIAQYTGGAAPSWPKQIWPQWSLWQFTDSGSVPGVTGKVDCNTFNGSAENCAKWFGPVAQPEPPPPPAIVAITIEAPAGIRITVNGQVMM